MAGNYLTRVVGEIECRCPVPCVVTPSFFVCLHTAPHSPQDYPPLSGTILAFSTPLPFLTSPQLQSSLSPCGKLPTETSYQFLLPSNIYFLTMFLYVLHMINIMMCSCLSFWLTSNNMVLSKSIHVAASDI